MSDGQYHLVTDEHLQQWAERELLHADHAHSLKVTTRECWLITLALQRLAMSLAATSREGRLARALATQYGAIAAPPRSARAEIIRRGWIPD